MNRLAQRAGVLALAGVTALAGAGCGSDSPTAAPTGPPPAPGYSRVTGAGFTLDVPTTWTHPALDPKAFEQTASALRAENPRLAQVLEESRASGGNRVFAIDPADGSSVNLIVTSTGGRPVDELVTQAVAELQQVGVTSVKREDGNLGGKRATVLEFSLPVRGASGTVDVPETQYYVTSSDTLFILTLFGGNPSLTVIAESVRFV